MRTNLISFVLVSENRKRVVGAILEYPDRQWSCSALEDITKLPHATVFRTLKGLSNFGILKTFKINKKTIIYESVKESPYLKELKKLMSIETITAKKIIKEAVKSIKSKGVYSIVLYGSIVKEESGPESDIDVLVVLKEPDYLKERDIFNIAADFSSRFNKTISPLIMSLKELNAAIKNKDPFINSIKKQMEVLYGKNPFVTS